MAVYTVLVMQTQFFPVSEGTGQPIESIEILNTSVEPTRLVVIAVNFLKKKKTLTHLFFCHSFPSCFLQLVSQVGIVYFLKLYLLMKSFVFLLQLNVFLIYLITFFLQPLTKLLAKFRVIMPIYKLKTVLNSKASSYFGLCAYLINNSRSFYC